MSSSNPPANNSEEEATKDEHREDVGSSTGQGRKLTPLPLSNPGAKPGQNQVSFEYQKNLKLFLHLLAITQFMILHSTKSYFA